MDFCYQLQIAYVNLCHSVEGSLRGLLDLKFISCHRKQKHERTSRFEVVIRGPCTATTHRIDSNQSGIQITIFSDRWHSAITDHKLVTSYFKKRRFRVKIQPRTDKLQSVFANFLIYTLVVAKINVTVQSCIVQLTRNCVLNTTSKNERH